MKRLYLLISLLTVILFLLIWQGQDPVYSPSYVADNSDSLNGKKVTVKGRIVEGRRICTQMFCGENNSCCNTCSASVVLKDNSSQITLEGPDLGCSGPSCNVRCTPETGEEYIVNGILKTKGARISLNVTDFLEVKG